MSPADDQGNTGPGSFTLHVLCPSLPSPNRFTLNDLPPSTTVADLKVCISQSIPSRPTPEIQKLLYLGKVLVDENVTLQSLFEPLNGSEFSVHLILPPSPPQPASTPGPNPSQTGSFEASRPQEPGAYDQQLRYRPNPLRPDEIAQSLRENARRRLMEVQELQRNDAFLPLSASGRPAFPTYNSGSRSPWQMSPSTPNTSIRTMMNSTNAAPVDLSDIGDVIQLPEESRARLRLLKQYVSLAEEQLNCGIAPTIDYVIQLRSHLFKLLDQQIRRPQSERGEFIEPLITRVFDVSARADALRQPRLSPIRTSSARERFENAPRVPMYILSSPAGYQGLCAPEVEPVMIGRDIRPPIAIQQANAVADARANAEANGQNLADPAVMENVVRQAVLNGRPAEGQLGLGRNLRRLWLFIRLYFFCHMFSAPGSQTRFLYVTLAVIAALLAETSVPRQMYEMVLAPVQRHLEGLVHFTPDEQLQPRTNGEATASQGPEAQHVRDGNWTAAVYHNLRRVERSAALFLASLVPGVGERHIEVRNAAEAARNAELARQEDERRRQEEAATEREENPSEDNDWSTRADTGAEAPNDTPAAIPQEAH